MQRPGQSFRHDQRGAVAVTYAIALFALVGIAGVAFDYSRLAGMDSELQNGADQAALAGATQLNGESGACSRAATAAKSQVDGGLISNLTLLANDGGSTTISIANETTCDAIGNIRFWQDEARTTAATGDANANFIEVRVKARTAKFTLTPIVGAFMADNISAAAMAGVGSSICKVPPLMICSPDPSVPFNASTKVGWGIQVTGHGNTRGGPGGTIGAWAPGDFGFLEVGAGQNADLVKALAFTSTTLDCVPIDGTVPETGNPQSLYDAINTRFDIYDFSMGNGTTLAPCFSGSCPAASNVVKDVVKPNSQTNGNRCKLHNQGWQLPDEDRQFWPKNTPSDGDGDGLNNYNDTSHSPSIDAMGLPRDLCHYTSYGSTCTGGAGGRFGDGNWARGDYFLKNHPGGSRPTGASTITRYKTYLWELANTVPNNLNAGPNKQYGLPLCSTGSAGSVDRRVLSVAIVKNCASLNGASTAVDVDEWIDVFLVEPVVDARPNGSIADSIYMEVIGPSTLGGTGGGGLAQNIRRDVPYLVR